MKADVFLARQPIFNVDEEVVAYELLYRSSGKENIFTGEVDADAASSKVIFNAFQDFGIENITSGLPAFINFSAKLIEEEVATLFSKEYLVVEILETVDPTPAIVEKCQALKDAGYHMALDDFVYSRSFESLLNLASVVKVDFLDSTLFDIKKLRARTLMKDCVLLAEKIETWEDFELAKSQGFTLFQGYFFEKPEMLTTTSLSPLELNYFQLVAAVNEDDLDLGEVAKLISMD
ncbi:MAG: EAL domain-containing protein, partial [Limnochordia bacterium]|nr:EAL domain-containing protein [Limnochordia bacterium]